MAGKPGRGGPIPKDLLQEMRSLDFVHGLAAYRKIVDLMQQSDSEDIQLNAAKTILEHARGKPKQSVELSGGLAFDLVGVIDEAHEAAMRKATRSTR